jgi:hypothetical protein
MSYPNIVDINGRIISKFDPLSGYNLGRELFYSITNNPADSFFFYLFTEYVDDFYVSISQDGGPTPIVSMRIHYDPIKQTAYIPWALQSSSDIIYNASSSI